LRLKSPESRNVFRIGSGFYQGHISTGPNQRCLGRGDIKVRETDPLLVQLYSALHNSMPIGENMQSALHIVDLLMVSTAWTGFLFRYSLQACAALPYTGPYYQLVA
jgi:hypothetical protein